MAFLQHLNSSADTENKNLAPQRNYCWTFCQVNKDFFKQDFKQDFIPPVSHFAPENSNYRFTAIWYPCLSLPIRHRCQSRLQFLPWRIALTSCLLSQWMCHYTTRSDGQNQKHNTAAWRYTSKVKAEVAQIHFQTGSITHTDEWPEMSANDETKFILVMNGTSLGAVLFVHMSA